MNYLMEIQEAISLSINESKVDSTLKVIIDREDPDFYVGRSEFDSPEVDGEVLIRKDKELVIGEFYNVEITGALPFDLEGVVE
jgi:ribosomal protein S12 methylthiotransferase